MIDTINNKIIHVALKLLMMNIVQKNHPNQYTSGVISSAEQCAACIQMNWSLFLLNQLMEDVVLAQEVGNSFTYSSLLVLIALVGWMDLTHYQGVEVDMVNICRGARYKNLWVSEHKQ